MGGDVNLLGVDVVERDSVGHELEEFKLMPKPRMGESYLLGTIGDAESMRDSLEQDGKELPDSGASRLAYLDKVFVEEDLRGQAIGSALVRRFIEIAQSMGVDAVYLEADNSDEVSEEFESGLRKIMGKEGERPGGARKQFRLVPWYMKFGFECLDGEDPECSPMMVLVLDGRVD